jgi:L-2-hydroxyglutarate oxidase LhgO
MKATSLPPANSPTIHVSQNAKSEKKKVKDPKEVNRGTEEMDMQKLKYDSS